MFKRIIFWSEFPKEVDWKKVCKLIDFNTEIYIAVKDKKEFLDYKKKIKSKHIKLGVWPILSKKEGYWFSGFSDIKSIDKLRQFKGMKVKIDLEPPIPRFNYSNMKILYWLIRMYFKKAKNKEYLEAIIHWLAEKNTKILVNEFLFPKFYLKKLGITVEKKKNMQLQLMLYSSPPGRFLRPILKFYNKLLIKKILKNNKDLCVSIGLIGPGVLKTEGYYKTIEEFQEDLQMVHELGLKNVAIYSIDTLMKRKNPRIWIEAIKKFIN